MPRFFKVQSAKFKVQMWCRCATTQMSATQWIPACAGMTIEKKSQNKKLKNMSSRCPGPAKTSVFVGGCRPRDPGHESPVRQHRQPFVIAREQRDRGDPVIYAVAPLRHICTLNIALCTLNKFTKIMLSPIVVC